MILYNSDRIERFFRVDIGDWDFVIRKNAPDDALRGRNPEFVEIQQRSAAEDGFDLRQVCDLSVLSLAERNAALR